MDLTQGSETSAKPLKINLTEFRNVGNAFEDAPVRGFRNFGQAFEDGLDRGFRNVCKT
jgi:hypothetical protein